MTALDNIKSCTVQTAENIHDYLQLTFSNKSILNVFNSYHYDGGEISTLLGRSVTAVDVRPELIRIEFSMGVALSIGMRDGDFRGPEAIKLKTGPTATIVLP